MIRVLLGDGRDRGGGGMVSVVDKEALMRQGEVERVCSTHHAVH